MIDINKFLEDNQTAIKVIITKFEVDNEFSSHDFIEKFSAEFESDYIDMLVKYQKGNDGKAFQTVHSLIAKFLLLNMSSMGIEKTQRKGSENVHGNIDHIQWWKRN